MNTNRKREIALILPLQKKKKSFLIEISQKEQKRDGAHTSEQYLAQRITHRTGKLNPSSIVCSLYQLP